MLDEQDTRELKRCRPEATPSVTPQFAKLLRDMGFSLQAKRKLREGKLPVAERDAQFRRINADVQDYQSRGQPVISIDTKKKELIGNFGG